MASNIVTIPDITSWWFRRVLGPDLIKCSSISAEEDNERRNELCVTTIESAIKGNESENISNKDNDSACEVIGLYFTPVNLSTNDGNVEEFTSKLVDLYDRVNYCCEPKCSDSECCNNKTNEVKPTEDKWNVRLLSCKHKVKTRKLEVIHVVLSSTGNASGVCTNVLEPGFDGNSVLDEDGFRKVIKGLPWFAIPHRDIHRTVRLLFATVLCINFYFTRMSLEVLWCMVSSQNLLIIQLAERFFVKSEVSGQCRFRLWYAGFMGTARIFFQGRRHFLKGATGKFACRLTFKPIKTIFTNCSIELKKN
jgi:hypothetical protein